MICGYGCFCHDLCASRCHVNTVLMVLSRIACLDNAFRWSVFGAVKSKDKQKKRSYKYFQNMMTELQFQ